MSFEDLPGLADSFDQIQKIAIGGMAEIFRARQKNLDRAVAIKRIRPELRDNKDIRERFRREARSSAVVLHHNIAHVYDYRVVGDDAYIIMEYIDGFDLAEIIEKHGALPLDVALMMAYRIVQGLSHIHAHGMIHRDLKPDNVRISTKGEVKIMDLGIAFDPAESNLTMPGVLIGSPHYLSPEQVIGAKLDVRADLFSFGITFFEMLTAKKPFSETQTESVYSRIQKGEYAPPQSLRGDLLPYYIQIIEQCLQVSPDRRPASANRLAAGMGEFLARNYSLAFEARVKQFLMQAGLLPGNPALIEIEERTGSFLDTVSAPSFAAATPKAQGTHLAPAPRRPFTIPAWLIALFLVGGLLGLGYHFYQKYESQEGAPAPAPAPAPAATERRDRPPIKKIR